MSAQEQPNPSAAASCGTPSGYRRHRRHNEPACEPCKAATAAWQREYRAANERIREERTANSRAHAAARKRLIALHRAEYDALVEEAKGSS